MNEAPRESKGRDHDDESALHGVEERESSALHS
jgi:hypothetical protein